MLSIDSFQLHARIASIIMVSWPIRKRISLAVAAFAAGAIALDVPTPPQVFGEVRRESFGEVKMISSLELVCIKGERYSFSPTSGEKEGVIFFFFEPNSAAGVLEMTFLERLYPKISRRE